MMTPTTIHKPKLGHFPAVILPSGKTRILTDVGFHSQTIALGLATTKVAKGHIQPVRKPKPKVDVNLPNPCRYTANKQNHLVDKTQNVPQQRHHVPTTFSSEGHDPPWFGDGIRYETPDVHKTDESHGSLDHLGVPGALPDQTPANVTAIELCRLFNVDRNLMQMQARATTDLTAWDEGNMAARGGKGKRSCPYVKGGIVYYDWMDGFNSYEGDTL